ncbi:MAG: hypothetical protein JWO86_389 [Myxococcaceae bacterium]|jgi:hypothetical protein|nr:hypothetical protein [Myxococcaceae bacterium]MEA2752183.1 hypothetical protein [Myxococcales bacterium]
MTQERAPSSDLRARILAEAARTPSPTRATHKRRVLLLATIGAIATVTLFVVMGGMAPGTRPVEMIAFTVGFGLIAAAVLTRLSSGEPRSMLGRPRTVLMTAVVVTAPVLAIVALFATLAWPAAAGEHVGSGVDLACGAISVLQGALPLIALLLPRRGTDPVHPAITGAALGMTAGAWTVVMAYLRCPHAAAMHCIVAHVVPTLILTALGAVLGWLLLRVRATPRT